MNRADKIFIGFVIICTIGLYSSLSFIKELGADKLKVAIVEFKGNEVLRIDMRIDANYEFEATMGTVYIEVKDQKIRVEEETSPYNYCSLQGWVAHSNTPIVCLPNDLIITIRGVDSESGTDFNLH